MAPIRKTTDPASFLAALLFATVALAPLPLGANRPFGWSALALLIGLILMAWGCASLRHPDLVAVPFHRYRWAALGFGVLASWVAIQGLWFTPSLLHHPVWAEAGAFAGARGEGQGAISMAPSETFTGLLRLGTYAAVFFLSLHLCRDRVLAQRALWVLMAAPLAYSIYGLFMLFGHLDMVGFYAKWLYLDSATGPFVNRNSFATYAGLGVLAALALCVHDFGRSTRPSTAAGDGSGGAPLTSMRFWMFMVAAIIMVGALALSHSRAGFASTVVGVAVLFAVAALRPGRTFRPAAVIAPLALGLVGATLVSGAGLAQRFLSDDTATTRRLIYQDTLSAIADHPLMGTGLGSFADAFTAYREPALIDTGGFLTMAHNTYLELALELGLPAFIVFMALLATLAGKVAVGSFRRRRDWIYPAFATAATVLVSLHSTVDFSMQMPAIAATYALILGLGFAQSQGTRSGRAATRPGVPAPE